MSNMTRNEVQVRNHPTVAIVDDDAWIREATKDLLDSTGLSVATFDSAERFLQSKDTWAVRCLIADMRMRGMTGLELHGRLAGAGTPIPTVLITAYPDELARARALEAGVVCFLAKPYCVEELLACVDAALHAGDPG